MITKKKLRKLKRDPKAFFLDSRFNLARKIKTQLDINYIAKNLPLASVKNIANESQLEEQYMLANQVQLLKPISKFDFDYLTEGLNNYGARAVYIKPYTEGLKSALCVLNTDKNHFIHSFLSFLYDERIELAYKIDGKVKKPKVINEIIEDWSQVRNIDVRLTTDRNIQDQLGRLWFRLEFCENEADYITFPTANQISRRLWKHTLEDTNLFKEGVQSYQSILNHPHEQEHAFDIDLVFTWVNSDDPDWQELYKQYKPDFNSDATSVSRFLSRDELKYALRSWEKYGSFIRKVFIVSNCAPPAWLDLNNSRVEWVYHESIMPESVLPTFSSHAIETSLHKIPGLSQHFIYSNDDFLLVKPLTKDNFYYSNGIAKLRLEPYGNVNGQPTLGEPDYLNAARNSNKLLEEEFGRTTTQLHTHSPQSMRKDILERMNQKYKSDFDRTMANKFRAMDDIAVTGYFYHHYALLSGNALQSSDKTELVQQNHDFVKKLNRIIELNQQADYNNLPLSVCINDGADSHLNDKWNIAVNKFLEALFPTVSSFEK